MQEISEIRCCYQVAIGFSYKSFDHVTADYLCWVEFFTLTMILKKKFFDSSSQKALSNILKPLLLVALSWSAAK